MVDQRERSADCNIIVVIVRQSTYIFTANMTRFDGNGQSGFFGLNLGQTVLIGIPTFSALS